VFEKATEQVDVYRGFRGIRGIRGSI
jgi:hypothetical protein